MPELTKSQKFSLGLMFTRLIGIIRSERGHDDNIEEGDKLSTDLSSQRSEEEKNHLFNQSTTREGNTILSIAAQKGRRKVTQILLQYENINLNHQNKSGQTPLSLACEEGHKDIVAILYDAELINTPCFAGYDPVVYAATNKHIGVMEYIYDRDPSQMNKTISEQDKGTAYMSDYAITFGGNNREFLGNLMRNLPEYCINHKIPLTNSHDTPLTRLLKKDDTRSAEILISRSDIDLTIKNNDKFGLNAFYIAAQKSGDSALSVDMRQKFEDIVKQVINRSIALKQDIDVYDEAEFSNPNIKKIIKEYREPANSTEQMSASSLLKRQKSL